MNVRNVGVVRVWVVMLCVGNRESRDRDGRKAMLDCLFYGDVIVFLKIVVYFQQNKKR